MLNIAVVFVLYLTPWYAPALSVTSDAALLFYGVSMLLAKVADPEPSLHRVLPRPGTRELLATSR